MIIKNLSLFVLLILIKIITAIPSNSYYLIAIDTNSSLHNHSYCSNISINTNLYYLPNQCRNHLLCDSHHCDDKTFRCMKIRETLCCLYKYIQKNCHQQNLKDQFRSIYFHTSIEHGYCDINLERIEQNDHSYCLANPLETTTTISQSRLPLKRFQQYRYRLSTQSSNLRTNISSKTSFIYTNFVILLLSMLL